jgi:hypothetical protein
MSCQILSDWRSSSRGYFVRIRKSCRRCRQIRNEKKVLDVGQLLRLRCLWGNRNLECLMVLSFNQTLAEKFRCVHSIDYRKMKSIEIWFFPVPNERKKGEKMKTPFDLFDLIKFSSESFINNEIFMNQHYHWSWTYSIVISLFNSFCQCYFIKASGKKLKNQFFFVAISFFFFFKLSIFCSISWRSPNIFIDDLPNFVWLESLHQCIRKSCRRCCQIGDEKKVLDIGQLLRLSWPLGESDPGKHVGSFVESNIRRTVSISFIQSITEKMKSIEI